MIIIKGSATVDESTISHNSVSASCYGAGYGGGIENVATLTLTSSTVSHNKVAGGCWAGGSGAGIANQGALTVTNSTVSSNVAEKGAFASSGGGISNSGTLRLRNTTISGNEVQSTDSTYVGTGAGIAAGGNVYLHNTIIAGNLNGDPRRPECSGTLISEGYNLIRNTLDCTITGNNDGNILNQTSGLTSLADHGGRTQTHALTAGSRAIDAGDPSSCPPTDQRAVTRPQDGNGDTTKRCDMGAYELQGASVPSNTPTTTPRPNNTPTRTPTTTPTGTSISQPQQHHVFAPFVTH